MHWPADLDPGDLKQPDARSCGAASALAARALVRDWRPGNAVEEILAEHKLLTSARSPRDRWQMPWPRALGTPPWAIVNAIRVLTGQHVATVFARVRAPIGFEVIRENLAQRPVPIYIGNRWLPRHVVLAVGVVHDGLGDGIEVFDPARGRLVRVPRENWTHHRVGIAGWTHLWFVI